MLDGQAINRDIRQQMSTKYIVGKKDGPPRYKPFGSKQTSRKQFVPETKPRSYEGKILMQILPQAESR